jgi:hypothetical protein
VRLSAVGVPAGRRTLEAGSKTNDGAVSFHHDGQQVPVPVPLDETGRD